jgi:hypothetical protein
MHHEDQFIIQRARAMTAASWKRVAGSRAGSGVSAHCKRASRAAIAEAEAVLARLTRAQSKWPTVFPKPVSPPRRTAVSGHPLAQYAEWRASERGPVVSTASHDRDAAG